MTRKKGRRRKREKGGEAKELIYAGVTMVTNANCEIATKGKISTFPNVGGSNPSISIFFFFFVKLAWLAIVFRQQYCVIFSHQLFDKDIEYSLSSIAENCIFIFHIRIFRKEYSYILVDTHNEARISWHEIAVETYGLIMGKGSAEWFLRTRVGQRTGAWRQVGSTSGPCTRTLSAFREIRWLSRFSFLYSFCLLVPWISFDCFLADVRTLDK